MLVTQVRWLFSFLQVMVVIKMFWEFRSLDASLGALEQRSLIRPFSPIAADTANMQPPKRDLCVLTFVGDTMIRAPIGMKEKDDKEWTVDKPFEKVAHLFKNSDYVVANLEGPITKRGTEYDPFHRGMEGIYYSFNMDPSSAAALKRLGVSAACMANNHFNDRGRKGIKDTLFYLREAGIESFGVGSNVQDAARPLMIETDAGANIGITGMSQLYKYGKALKDDDKTMGVIRPVAKDAAVAIELQHDANADFKIAFVHWGTNYAMDPVKDELDDYAQTLAKAGFDLIIGSDGSHTSQAFDYVHGVPTLYNIGNFAMLTPGRFWMDEDPYGDELLPYGTVVHTLFDEDGHLHEIQLHCIHANNLVTKYMPRPCNPGEAGRLFGTMGPHVQHVKGDVHATIRITPQTISNSGRLQQIRSG